MEKEIFISYSHDDKEFVDKLCVELEKIGISYFRDEKDIDWGISIGKKVTEGLSSSAGVLLIISPASHESAWVPYETGYAYSLGKNILPLIAYPKVKLPGYLGDIKYFSRIEEAIKFFQSDTWKVRSKMIRRLHGLREITISQAANQVGLIDIVERKNELSTLPPIEYYSLVKREIAFSGISAFRTFDQHFDVLQKVIEEKKNIFVLIMAPDAPIIEKMKKAYKLDLRSQIEDVIDRIKRVDFIKSKYFKIRFLNALPVFTANMIDGDILAYLTTPNDEEGQIRVQHMTHYQRQHHGIICHYAKIANDGGFNLFASDFREQWEKDGIERTDLF